MQFKQAHLVIYRSPNGRDQWEPCMPQDVPAWVKHPDNMAKLVAGEACMKADEGETGSDWYRAGPEEALERIQAAQAKRARKAERNRTVH